MKLKPEPHHAGFLLFLVTLFWGTSFPFIKYLANAVDPIVVMFYRFTIASVVLGVGLKFSGRKPFQNLKSGLVTGVLLWLIFFPQMVGIRYTSASNSAFLTGLFVVFVPVFTFLIHRRLPTVEHVIAVLIALFGLWLLTGGISDFNKGDLITLGTALSCGAYIVVLEIYAMDSKDALALSFQQLCVVAILGFVQIMLTGLSFRIPDVASLSIVVYLAVFVTLIALTVQTWAQRHVSPMKAALIFTAEPVIAAIISNQWLGEKFTFWKTVGAVLIVLAMTVAALPIGKWLKPSVLKA